MFGLMLTSTHDEIVRKLKAEIAKTGVLRTNAEDLCRRYVTLVERLEDELAPLKAARERANANLVAANARRKLAKVA